MADYKLRGKMHRVIVRLANDDMFELDSLMDQQGHVVETNDQDPLDLEGFQMISLGWTNPAPRNTFRELPENELAKRVDELVAKVTDPHARSSTSTPGRTAADSTKTKDYLLVNG